MLATTIRNEYSADPIEGYPCTAAAVLPSPGSGIPFFWSANTFSIDHRQILAAPRSNKSLYRRSEVVANVDDEKNRPIAEAMARTKTAGSEYFLVTLGQEFIPNWLTNKNFYF
jgi:hypothetical protein